MSGNSVAYAVEPGLDPDEFIDVLNRSGLAERRPVRDEHRIGRMLANSSLIVTARRDGLLVGVARSVTDFSYCCYLSDLAVDRTCQNGGIGQALISRTQAEAGPEAMLILIAAPAADDYYAHIGMQRIDRGWFFPRKR